MEIREAVLEDFDRLYDIYMHPAVNSFMSFPIIRKEEFLPVFKGFLEGIFVHEVR